VFVGTEIEVVRPEVKRGGFRSVLFDFDGTLSLIREGWQQVMVPMMVEELGRTGTPESEEQLRAVVETFVTRLTGKQTIYQMIQLAEEVGRRGGKPLEPLAYKHRYHDLLMQRIRGRIEQLESGDTRPEDWVVPGSHALLQGLRRRGVMLYLASGTDLAFVRHEAKLLGVAEFFGDHIYGAVDDYKTFSKRMVIERIVREHDLGGAALLGFGDGFVEIEEVKRVGGLAVAVASDEASRAGVDWWKRQRLIEAGADVVIPEYRQHAALLDWLFTPPLVA
jgi:phosphoglycolate phosphatase-like HAD superfamily hydrolase